VGALGVGESTTLTYFLIFDTTTSGARRQYETLIGGGQPFEPNETLAGAISTGLVPDVEQTITAFVGDGPFEDLDVDLFAFNAQAGDMITADIDAEVRGTSLDSILRLFDSTGTEIAFNDDSDGLDSFISVTIPTDRKSVV